MDGGKAKIYSDGALRGTRFRVLRRWVQTTLGRRRKEKSPAPRGSQPWNGGYWLERGDVRAGRLLRSDDAGGKRGARWPRSRGRGAEARGALGRGAEHGSRGAGRVAGARRTRSRGGGARHAGRARERGAGRAGARPTHAERARGERQRGRRTGAEERGALETGALSGGKL